MNCTRSSQGGLGRQHSQSAKPEGRLEPVWEVGGLSCARHHGNDVTFALRRDAGSHYQRTLSTPPE
eukprot:2809785-Heterocapsa_arctica.AAC.1